MKPILSICIPTLNRSVLLEVLLENLEREASTFLDRIEIVVGDNASVDATADVVRKSSIPIVYGKQERTVGFARNMLFTAVRLASGEFVWVIGDDDLVLSGGVARVLKSINDAPDVDYHYLNFGWIDFRLRARIVREENGLPYASLLKHLQFNDGNWKRLPCLEDLVFLSADNPSAIFSGVFCFVTRRQFFSDAVEYLQPSNSLDGSSTIIADCFPHAMLSLPRMAGKPIAYIGEPCLMQGIKGWEWGSYAHKNMIYGTHQFFEWLEKSAFSSKAMQHLWRSYYQMAGRLFFHMLYLKDEHKGLEIVIDKVIPDSASHLLFWDAFMAESLLHHNMDHDARAISEWVNQLVAENPSAKIGLWGIGGRGYRFIQFSPHLRKNLVWAVDMDRALQGVNLVGTDLNIFHPDTMCDMKVDVLVIGTRSDFVAEIIKRAEPLLQGGGHFVSVKGVNGCN